MENQIELQTGGLNSQQIDLVLTHLPVDITFVDAEGHVQYYSDSKHRIFRRVPGIIGRHVEKCHPSSSVDKVKQIVDAFQSGKKDSAEFWIRLKERLILIRYFALRDGDGTYQGTMEVSQDVTDIQKLEGERRLLDWD